ncbi:MAG: aminoglycoside phosphotransferase family protein [Candidatus Micrarchaeota archaeon]|nr:aminoglycoside phosphotransferase family protein [Candidatus Micrarchaeota archaeon]
MEDVYYAVAHRKQEEIDSFKKRYDVFDTSLIPKIFQQSLGIDAVKWDRSKSWGSSHVIYFVEVKGEEKPLVLRANTGFNKEPETMMLVEKMVTGDVASLGVPTNTVRFVDVTRKKFPFDYQIEEMLRGQDLEDHFKGDKKTYDEMSFQLGSLVAKIHTLEYPGFGRFDFESALRGELRGSKTTFYEYVTVRLDSDLEYLRAAKLITAAISDKILDAFQERKQIINIKQGVLVHHDLADHNIMFEGAMITGIFDWEACVVGDPVLDLASCPTWKTHYPREEKLIEGYKSVTELPSDFEEKMKIYRLRTMLWKMVYAIRANILGTGDVRVKVFNDSLTALDLK